MFENSKNLSFCIKLGRLYPIIIITFEIKSTLYLDTKCNFILKQFIHLHTIFFKCALILEAQTILNQNKPNQILIIKIKWCHMNFWVKIYILSNYQLKYKSEVTLCLMFIVYRSIIKNNWIFKEKSPAYVRF